MTKETARDIAIALIAVSGKNFDGEAFGDCDDLINEDEKRKIMNEIELHCQKMMNKIQSKYRINLKASTAGIIDQILYE